MALVDLKTKQSLLGLRSPISDMDEKIGPKFAKWRNMAYGGGLEPYQDEEGEDLNIIDTIPEKSLTQGYTYGYGSPYPPSSQTYLHPSFLDKFTKHEKKEIIKYTNPEQNTIKLEN